MKKLLPVLLFICVVISIGGCAPMDTSLEAIEGKDGVFAIFETTKGNIVCELYYKDTPLTVVNFVGLAEGTLKAAKGKKFYDGLKFHRVISNFMIQGGDPKGNGTGGPGYRFPDEILSKYKFTGSGILAMANAGANTNGSQFFITHVATPHLNGKHTIFGKVVDGQDTVNRIRMGDIIKKITIVRQGEEAEKFTANQEDFDRLLTEIEDNQKKAQAKAQEEMMRTLDEKYGSYTKDSNGIRYNIINEGTGEKIGEGKNVTCKYKGYLIDGTVFDDSDYHAPLEFTTASGRMIQGFDLMVQDMKLNEKRTIVLPPEYAYGPYGAGNGLIPPNAYIAFDVEVINVQ